MKTSIKIGKVYGIPIKLHFTLIFVIAFIAWSIGANVFQIAELLGIDPTGISAGFESYLLGIVLAIGLFISVFIHEMAHSILSIKNDIKVEEITLWIFGGMSSMEEIPSDPNLEMKISAVGPLSSLGIGAVCFGIGYFVGIIELVFIFKYLALINFILAGFNLIPAFPMDGGRILRSLLARKRSYVKATKIAAEVGKVFAIFFGILGIFTNLFLILIAFFIYIGASQESQTFLLRETLHRVNIRDIMSDKVKTVPPDMNNREFLDMVMEHQHTGFPVLSDDRVVGIMTLQDAKKVPDERIDAVDVKEVMEKEVVCVNPEDDVSNVWETMIKKQVGRFPVLENDKLVGIVTRSDIMHSFEILKDIERYRGGEI
ncbi:MAG: site-2 protease family protein [Thermoplasmata archaeon]